MLDPDATKTIKCCKRTFGENADGKLWGARCTRCGKAWLWGPTMGWLYVGHMKAVQLAKMAGR